MNLIKKITTILTIASLVLINFMPFTVNLRGVEAEEVGAEAGEAGEYPLIIQNSLFKHLDFWRQETKQFIWSQKGVLKDIDQPYQPNIIEQILDAAGVDSALIINPRVLLTIIELKSGAITNPQFQKDKLRSIFDITDEQYQRMIQGISAAIGYSGDTYFQEESVDSFHNQLAVIAYTLSEASRECGAETSKFIFLDGKETSVAKIINCENYAVQKVLSLISPNEEIWQQWISQKEGSFYQVYKQWFGDPIGEASKAITTEEVAFLDRPLDGLPDINSYVDHDTPDQKTKDGNLLRFDRETLPDPDWVDCDKGLNCYDSHCGIDYNVSAVPVYSAYEGEVYSAHNKDDDDYDEGGHQKCTEDKNDKTNKNQCCWGSGWGCNVVLKHVVGGHTYYTRYGHLKFGTIPDDIIRQ